MVPMDGTECGPGRWCVNGYCEPMSCKRSKDGLRHNLRGIICLTPSLDLLQFMGSQYPLTHQCPGPHSVPPIGGHVCKQTADGKNVNIVYLQVLPWMELNVVLDVGALMGIASP